MIKPLPDHLLPLSGHGGLAYWMGLVVNGGERIIRLHTHVQARAPIHRDSDIYLTYMHLLFVLSSLVCLQGLMCYTEC